MKKSAKEVEVDQTSASSSKSGISKQTDTLPLNTAPNTQLHPNTQPSEHTDEPMEMHVYGPSLPPRFGQSSQSEHGSDLNHGSDHQSEQPKQVCSARTKKHSDNRKHKVQAKYISQSTSSEEDQSSVHIKRSA